MQQPMLLRLRAVVFAAIALYLLAGPVSAQVFKKVSPVLPKWQMFAGYGLDVCKVRYAMIEGDGIEIPLDRYATLGFTDRFDAPRSLWRVPDAKTALSIGRRMCTKVDESSPDIRVWASCAARDGWKVEFDGQKNLCRGARRRR